MIQPFFIILLFSLIGCRTEPAASQAVRETPRIRDSVPAESPPRPRETQILQAEKEQAADPVVPLGPAEAVHSAVSRLPRGKTAVSGGGGPLFFLHDLDADAVEDVILLAVGADRPEKASFGHLSDFRRLYDPAGEDFPFTVEVFLRKGREVVHAKSVDAGTRRVCAAFSELQFPASGRLPYGVSLLFPSTDGKEHVWVLFSSPGKHAVFTFREKADVRAYTRDVDGNGTADLLLFEDVFEDSTGYETYITWYRWDGTTYRKHRSTNIVRNLRKFFATAGDLLSVRSWRRFLEFTLAPRDAEASRKKDVAKTLDRIFKFSPLDGVVHAAGDFSFSAETLKREISEVVFPEVLENPFPLGADGPESFPFTIRVTADGENYFFTARLGMNRNPFGTKMFHFLPY